MAIKEVCIAARPSASGNTLEGDIILIRNPVGEIGKKERADYLWLLIDERDLPTVEETRKDGTTRARVDLDELKAKHPSLDLEMVRSEQEYQPFVNPRSSDGKFQAGVRVKNLSIQQRDNSNSPVHQQRLIQQILSR
jgi:hypothetical protein